MYRSTDHSPPHGAEPSLRAYGATASGKHRPPTRVLPKPQARRTFAYRRLVLAAAVSALTALAAACGGGETAASSASVERDSVGDTLVVRTLAGSAWGGESGQLVAEVSIGVLDGPEELILGSIRSLAVGSDGTIYAMDGQLPAVRVFDSQGSFVQTLGRDGGGPGEFGQPDGGMAILSDGRLVVRDPGNARLQVFDPSGEPIATWPVIPGGFNTSNPMHRTAGDTLLTPVLVDREADVADWQMGLQRVAPDGAIVDTVLRPDANFEAPTLEARHESEGGTSVSINGVPYSPDEQTSLHPDGYFIHGISDRYAFTLLRPGAFLRIERDVEPALVTAGEKAESEASTTRNMRGTDPNWRWNGPGIPDRKPYYERIYSAEDGRIWVVVELEGVEGDDPDYDPTDPDSIEDRWRSRHAFDLFQTDGTFVGRVAVPEELQLYPTPVFRGDYVWAVTRDDLDVQRIVRYRIEPPRPPAG
jgi:hypothetical protein